MDDKLALKGGKPVRETPLPPYYPGAVSYGDEEKRAVMEVLDRKSPFRYYGPDPAWKVKEFECGFAEMVGVKHALAVTSGTASLIVALKALGIGPGDKVIVPANTFIATPGAVVMAGAVPVFADIDESLNMNPVEISRLSDSQTKAVIPVHILGNPCDMNAIMNEAGKYNLQVIEDAAQSCGCQYRGRKAGSFGDVGCFSLQINKIISTGDGGVVVTNNDATYERAVRYHDHGMFREREGFLAMKSEDDVFIGQNYRMSELTGAIAVEQLKKLDGIINTMKCIKSRIKLGITDIDGIDCRKILDSDGDASNALVLLLPDAEKARIFRDALQAENVTAAYLYGGRPVHMLPQILRQKSINQVESPFRHITGELVYHEGMCPIAEQLLPRNAVIFISPLFSEQDIDDIVRAIRKTAKHIL